MGVLAHAAQHGQASLFAEAIPAPPFPDLQTMEKLSGDFILKGYSEHPVHLVDLYRNELLGFGAIPMERLGHAGGHVRTAGLVVARQKPPTAKGFFSRITLRGRKWSSLPISGNGSGKRCATSASC